MEKKVNVNCSVKNCVFNHDCRCDAHEITVGCDCQDPCRCRDTECNSYRKRG